MDVPAVPVAALTTPVTTVWPSCRPLMISVNEFVDRPMLTGVDTGVPLASSCTVLAPVVPWMAVVGTRSTLVAVAVAIETDADMPGSTPFGLPGRVSTSGKVTVPLLAEDPDDACVGSERTSAVTVVFSALIVMFAFWPIARLGSSCSATLMTTARLSDRSEMALDDGAWPTVRFTAVTTPSTGAGITERSQARQASCTFAAASLTAG